MKTCTVCQIDKELSEFFNSSSSKDGKGYRCKPCDKEIRRVSRSRSPQTQEGYRRRKIAKLYGVTPEWYDETLAGQGGCCAICGTSNPLGEGNERERNFSFSVDHCHETGAVRGLLCAKCNRGLGLLQDSQDVLTSALIYLQKHH